MVIAWLVDAMKMRLRILRPCCDLEQVFPHVVVNMADAEILRVFLVSGNQGILLWDARVIAGSSVARLT